MRFHIQLGREAVVAEQPQNLVLFLAPSLSFYVADITEIRWSLKTGYIFLSNLKAKCEITKFIESKQKKILQKCDLRTHNVAVCYHCNFSGNKSSTIFTSKCRYVGPSSYTA